MNKERYILQPSADKPNHWVVTDTDNGIVCVFEQGKFNDTQAITILDDAAPDMAMRAATYMRELGDWLAANHYDKLF